MTFTIILGVIGTKQRNYCRTRSILKHLGIGVRIEDNLSSLKKAVNLSKHIPK